MADLVTSAGLVECSPKFLVVDSGAGSCDIVMLKTSVDGALIQAVLAFKHSESIVLERAIVKENVCVMSTRYNRP